uniref:Odorant receptor n=1 Tax=Eucryptorrhynchus brandti TaxID=436910 RepID=A0A8F4RRC9_EUCBR|nr:odorant receptor 32 [Eucryptorrhynchus brandti]
MYNADNEKLISWTKKILICTGLWNLPITNNHVYQKIFYIYSMFMRLGCFMFWLLLFCELIRLIIYKYDTELIITSLGVVVNDSKILFKVIIYLKHNILGLFKDVIEKEADIWSSNNEEIITLYKRNIRTCKLYVIVLGFITLVAVSLLQIPGAINFIAIVQYNIEHNATVEPHVMYQIFLPFNKVNHMTWLFTIEAFLAWVGATYNTATHLIFLTLLVYAASQLQVLQIKLKNYDGLDFSSEASQEEIDERIVVLKGLIRDHQQMIGFVIHSNKCTRYVIMMEFILSSLDLASVSANLIKMDSGKGWLLVFFVLLFVQIMLIGWTSNEIKIQSEAIADAVYESKWYLLNKEAKQLTQIMIARAQTPLLMTIGPFGPMTTNSVLMVLKAAYSYVSIMRE